MSDLHVLLSRLVVLVGVRRVPQLDLLLLQLALQLRLRVQLRHRLETTTKQTHSERNSLQVRAVKQMVLQNKMFVSS